MIYKNSSGGTESTDNTVDRQTFNLFDKTQMVSGSHHYNVVAGGFETHKIIVKPGYVNKGDGIATQYSFYDENDAFISGGSAKSAKAPANARSMYVYFNNINLANVLMVMETNYMFADYVPYTQKFIPSQAVQGWYRSKWFEKNWWVLGDSISTGWGDGTGAGNQYATKQYHYLIARDRNIRVQNDAISGYTIGNIYDKKVVNMPPTAYAPDLITIMQEQKIMDLIFRWVQLRTILQYSLSLIFQTYMRKEEDQL